MKFIIQLSVGLLVALTTMIIGRLLHLPTFFVAFMAGSLSCMAQRAVIEYLRSLSPLLTREDK